MIPLELSACFDDEFTCTADGKCVDIEKRCDKYPNCKGKCRLPYQGRNPPTKLDNLQTSVADSGTRIFLSFYTLVIFYVFLSCIYLHHQVAKIMMPL